MVHHQVQELITLHLEAVGDGQRADVHDKELPHQVGDIQLAGARIHRDAGGTEVEARDGALDRQRVQVDHLQLAVVIGHGGQVQPVVGLVHDDLAVLDLLGLALRVQHGRHGHRGRDLTEGGVVDHQRAATGVHDVEAMRLVIQRQAIAGLGQLDFRLHGQRLGVQLEELRLHAGSRILGVARRDGIDHVLAGRIGHLIERRGHVLANDLGLTRGRLDHVHGRMTGILRGGAACQRSRHGQRQEGRGTERLMERFHGHRSPVSVTKDSTPGTGKMPAAHWPGCNLPGLEKPESSLPGFRSGPPLILQAARPHVVPASCRAVGINTGSGPRSRCCRARHHGRS